MHSSSILQVAVFDLNQTVYRKSSKEEFYKYICYRKKNKLLDLFQMGLFTLMKEAKLMNKTDYKENFFNYLDKLPPALVEEYAKEFWSVEFPKYFHQPLLERIRHLQDTGVKIIFVTGTLDVYVKPLFETILIPDYWIATRTQYIENSYKVIGRACKDEEKINRLNQLLHPQAYEIKESYSDKKEDILMVAQQPFLLKYGEIIPLSS